MTRRTKGKSSGSCAEFSLEKRAGGCQALVEDEDFNSFPTVLHVLRSFSKNPNIQLGKFKTSPAGCPEELSDKPPI